MAPPPVERIGESTSGEAHRSLPTPFLTKTYQLVDDPSIDDIISWSDDGSTFIVWRPAEFARDLLPKYFKHNNFSSFVRQLNTYGFRKIVPDRWEFANDYFRRGEKRLLREIHRRKIPPAVATTATTTAAVTASVAGSLTNSGDEQVRSSSSSPTIVAATLCRTRSCGSAAELQDENERLKRENTHLAHELTQMKNLCNNILVLMANYAGGSQQETSVFLTEKALDLLPAKRFSNEAVAAGEFNQSQAKTDDETSPRLFGVSIGVKRTRGCEEDEEQEQQMEQSQSQKPEPLDQISDHQDRHWIKYCAIPNQRVCN